MLMGIITTWTLRPVEQQDLAVFAGWIRALGRENDPGKGDLESYLLLEFLESIRLHYPQQFLVLEQENPILHITSMPPAGNKGGTEKVGDEDSAGTSDPFQRLYTLINPAFDQEEYWVPALKKALSYFFDQDGIQPVRVRLSEPGGQQEKALWQLGFRPSSQKGWYEGSTAQ